MVARSILPVGAGLTLLGVLLAVTLPGGSRSPERGLSLAAVGIRPVAAPGPALALSFILNPAVDPYLRQAFGVALQPWLAVQAGSRRAGGIS